MPVGMARTDSILSRRDWRRSALVSRALNGSNGWAVAGTPQPTIARATARMGFEGIGGILSPATDMFKLERMVGRIPIVLIHGLGDTARLFRRMAAHLEQTGHKVHCLDLVPNNGDTGLDDLALQIKDYVAEQFGPEEKFALVGFSMGGIVSRFYVQRLGGIERVLRFVTISAPHRGTWTAWLRANPGIRQMRPGSSFLRDLNDDCSVLERTGFVSIWTRFDLMIVPAQSSILPTGRSIHVGAIAHPLMVNDRRVLRLVAKLLSEAP